MSFGAMKSARFEAPRSNVPGPGQYEPKMLETKGNLFKAVLASTAKRFKDVGEPMTNEAVIDMKKWKSERVRLINKTVYLEKEIAKRQSLNGDKENIPDVEVKELQNSLQQTKEELDQWLLDAAVLARKQTENQVKMRLSFHLPCDKEDEVDYENEDSSQEVIAALRAQYEEKVNELNLAISENEKLSKSLQDSEVHAKQNHSLMIQVADSLEKLKHLNELLRNSAENSDEQVEYINQLVQFNEEHISALWSLRSEILAYDERIKARELEMSDLQSQFLAMTTNYHEKCNDFNVLTENLKETELELKNEISQNTEMRELVSKNEAKVEMQATIISSQAAEIVDQRDWISKNKLALKDLKNKSDEVSSLLTENQIIKEKQSDLEKSLESTVIAYEKEKLTLENRLNEILSSNLHVGQENEMIKSENTSLKIKIESLTEKLSTEEQNLETCIVKLNVSETSLNDYNLKIQSLQNDYNRLSELKTTMEKNLDQMNLKLEDVSLQLKSKSIVLEKTQNSLESVWKENTDFREQVNNAKIEIDNLNNSMKQLQLKFDEQVSSSILRDVALKTSLSKRNTQLSELQSQYDESKKDYETLSREFKMQTEIVNSLKVQISESELKFQSNFDYASSLHLAKIFTLEESLVAMKDKLKISLEKEENLTRKLEDIESRNKEIVFYSDELKNNFESVLVASKELESRLQESRSEVVMYQSTVVEKDNIISENNALYSTQLQEMSKSLQEGKEIVSKLQIDSKNKFESWKLEREELRSKLIVSDELLQSARQEILVLNEATKVMTENVSNINLMRSQIEESNFEHEQMEQLKYSFSLLENENSKLREDNAELKLQIEEKTLNQNRNVLEESKRLNTIANNATAVGHQNSKQKIHYIQILKEENEKLRKGNLALQSELKSANVLLKKKSREMKENPLWIARPL